LAEISEILPRAFDRRPKKWYDYAVVEPKTDINMLAAGGVHPYALRRRKAVLSRSKPKEHGLGPSLIAVMLFLAGFAYGLRWIDQRLAPTPDRHAPAPARELDASVSGQLSEALRFIFGVRTAHAADYTTYAGALVGSSPVITAGPGETRTIDLVFKNTGRATWSDSGKSYVSAYTIKPRYHASVFRSSDWYSSSQTARIATPIVRPGETGILRLTVTAPQTPGTYVDTFQIAAEDTSWIWGAWTTVTVKVSASAPVLAAEAPKPAPAASPAPAGASPSAILLLKSAQKVSARGNASVSFTVGHKNAGATSWSSRSIAAPDGNPIITLSEPVAPGTLAFTTFTFIAPKTRGDHVLKFPFTVDGQVIPEAALELPVTVTDDFVEAPKVPIAAPTSPSIVSLGGSEPTIRVGLYYTEVEREEFVADVPYEVRNLDGVLIASFQAGAPVQAWYDAASGVYRLTNGIVNLSSASALRFVPLDPNGIVTALAHVDRPSWNSSLNDNRFRGVIEFRRHSSGRVWAINELPMEQYLWGLAESSNASPMEFQKALAVAARSYAAWHLDNPGKYDHFTVGALNDQVYKGYGMELRNPNFKAAAEATRGQVVYHAGTLAITPYFTWSDGRTRAWTEVWGGAHKPWLVSVAAPHDAAANRQLYGHGVGMSAWDAIGRANAGESYDTMLKHYYQGTELKKRY